jgi:AcrR family transcriptional regulator
MHEQGGARRRYHSPRRAEQAAATRAAVLAAAWELFVTTGYRATTIADVAARARVAVDTVYATVGRKPALLRELLESALAGTSEVARTERPDYVHRIRVARTAREKIAVYAQVTAELHQRMAPVFLAMRDAAATDPECAILWEQISQRRARNLRGFAAGLRRTGELRHDLSDDEVADIVWSMNAAEYWVLLVHERGWSPARFAAWLADAWTRLLLTRP